MKTKPVNHYNITVHFPETETGRQELARRVSAVHVQTAMEKLSALSCPLAQKLALIDEVIERRSKTR